MDEASLQSDSTFKEISFVEFGDRSQMKVLTKITNVQGTYVFSLREGSWVKLSAHDVEYAEKSTLKVNSDDLRARRHYVKTIVKDAKALKSWQCGICLKEFKFQYTLMRHIPTHTDERNYRCTFCSKAFRQMSTLTQHKATHENKRPYSCSVCEKSFNRASTLISHKKIHETTKTHVCCVCGKGFHQKGNLRNHMHTHSNARPYKCEHCGKGFNQKSNLVCHEATHGICKTQFCGTCGESLSTKRDANYHFMMNPGCKGSDAKPVEIKLEPDEKEDSSNEGCLAAERNANRECHSVERNGNPSTHARSEAALELKYDAETPKKSPTCSNSVFGEYTILTILKTKPTEAMKALCIDQRVMYCLLYRPNSVDPIFCKAILRRDEIVVVTTRDDSSSKLNVHTPMMIFQKIDSASGKVTAFLNTDKHFIPVEVPCDEQSNNFNYFDYYKLKEAQEIIQAHKLLGPQVHSYTYHTLSETGMNNASLPSSSARTETNPDARVCLKNRPLVVPVFELRKVNIFTEQDRFPVVMAAEPSNHEHFVVNMPTSHSSQPNLTVAVKEQEPSEVETTEKELMKTFHEIDFSNLIEAEQCIFDGWLPELFQP